MKGRDFITNILRKCVTCKKFNSRSYQYPTTPPLKKFRMCDNFEFYTTGVDNFGPLIVKSMFSSDSSTIHKVWVTLHTCASSRALLLGLVPSKSSLDFIKSFKRFVSRSGVPNNVISDVDSNFVSDESQEFMNGFGVNWVTNTPLSPWYGGFFERLVRSTKELLRKMLKGCRLNYEELQTNLLETEAILNNRPLTNYFHEELEDCLSPNHMLFERSLKLFDPDQGSNEIIPSKKLHNIINHFWDSWRKEYLLNLSECQKIQMKDGNRKVISAGDIVLIEEDKVPRFCWRMELVERLINGKYGAARGAVVRVSKTRREVLKPVNKLYPIESIENKKKEMNDASETIVTRNRPRREAAVIGYIKRRFVAV